MENIILLKSPKAWPENILKKIETIPVHWPENLLTRSKKNTIDQNIFETRPGLRKFKKFQKFLKILIN